MLLCGSVIVVVVYWWHQHDNNQSHDVIPGHLGLAIPHFENCRLDIRTQGLSSARGGFFRGETKDNHPDMQPWFTNVPHDPLVKNDVLACWEFLQTAKGATDFGVMGFCWGAWAIACTHRDVSGNVVILPHPSFCIESWIFGGNNVELMQSIPCPVLLMPASNDPDCS